MSNPLITGPNNDSSGPPPNDNTAGAGEEHDPRAHPYSRKRPRIATEDECMAALTALAQLVLLGLVPTARANAIRANYQAIMNHHRQQRNASTDGDGSRGLGADNALVDALLAHPELASSIEPLLSDEQIASLLARTQDGKRGSP